MDNHTKFKGDTACPDCYSVARSFLSACVSLPRTREPRRPERTAQPSEYQTERLAALGKLWGAVKFFHPFLAYKDIDWDGALVKAIPRVKAARTRRPSTSLRSTACSTCWRIPRQGPKRPQMSLRQHPRLPRRRRSLAIFGSSTTTSSSTLPDWPRRWRVAVPRQVRSRCRQRSPKPVASCSIAVSAALAPTVSSRTF